MMIRRGKNRIVSKNAFFCERIYYKQISFTLCYLMQHSIVRFIHKDLKKNGRGKEANDKYRKLYQNRIKKKEKNSENTGKLQSLPKLETECFFFVLFAFYELCLLQFLSNCQTITSCSISFFFKLLDRHKLRHCAKFYQDGMVAFSVLDKAGRRGVLPNISY